MYVARMSIATQGVASITREVLEVRLNTNLSAQAVGATHVAIEQIGEEWRLYAEVEFEHLIVVVCNETLELFRQVFPQGFREISSRIAA